MKFRGMLIPFFAISLTLGACGGNSNNTSLKPLKDLFESLNSNYNFTLDSFNESNARRKLEVFDKYCYYYTYQNRASSGSNGAFYIEGQGVQDFVIKNNQVNVLFHEGVGKIEVVEEFTHDDYGNQFAHIPLSSLLSVEYKKFKKENNSFVSTDKDINRTFIYFTNNYFANWEKGNEEAYVDFSKSKTTISFSENQVTVTFIPSLKNIGFEYTGNGSSLTISSIGNTHNRIIENYVSNPIPLEKKSSYGFNEEKYRATFGTATIPFSNKYSEYLDVVEYYSDSAINIFDICYGEGIVEDIISNLSSNWKESQEDSEYWTAEYGFDVHAYCTEADIEEQVEETTVTNTVEVYFLFGISPVDLEETESGKILRPNGYFVGQLYRKLGEEAIEGYENINAFFTNIGINSLVPDFARYASLSLTMRDYSENPAIQASFANQGLYLIGYYQITFGGVTNQNISAVVNALKNDFTKISFYSSVTVDDEHNLIVTPDYDKFSEDGTFPMQAIGSPLKNEQNEIYAYVLIIIVFTSED